MIIYKLKPDTNFRLMYPDDDVYNSDEWEFKCKPLAEKLPQFSAYFDKKSDKPLPDIAYIGMLTFAFRRDVASELLEILEKVGELLPFYVGGEPWYCLNVLESTDALDEEKTKYQYDDGKTKFNPIGFVFDVNKLPESSLFKIPEDNHTNIFCIDRREIKGQIMGDFFYVVDKLGLTGVKFERVYSTD